MKTETASETAQVALAHLGVIRASGADADAFLQGQLSNDVRSVTATRGQISSYNSPKGRMLAVLHLRREGDALLLELPREILPAVLKRLQMYVLRSKVRLEDATEATPLLGVAGPGAEAALREAGLPVPAEPMEVVAAVMRRHGSVPRFVVAGPAPALAAARGTIEHWRRHEIDAGVPTVFAATQDRFVPQMCNLDQLGGISFDKGCYTGQEVVARVHYLGAVKRRMSRVELAGAPPAPGAKIDQGEVVDAVALPGSRCAALVVGS